MHSATDPSGGLTTAHYECPAAMVIGRKGYAATEGQTETRVITSPVSVKNCGSQQSHCVHVCMCTR